MFKTLALSYIEIFIFSFVRCIVFMDILPIGVNGKVYIIYELYMKIEKNKKSYSENLSHLQGKVTTI